MAQRSETTSCCAMKLFTILLCLAAYTAQAQMPQIIAIPLQIESPDLRDGLYDVTVRWYDQAIGGLQFGTEMLAINIKSGVSTITLGNASPLPRALLETGSAWISIQFVGVQEPTFRYHVTPQAFAQTAAFALVAASLDPRATGLVTSINEMAGALELRGTRGIRVQRDGRTLTIMSNQIDTAGEFHGDGKSYEFSLPINDSGIATSQLECTVFSRESLIHASAWFDSTSATYRIRTSAILMPGETLRWKLFHH